MPQTDPTLPVGDDRFLDRIREAERDADAIIDRARADAERTLSDARDAAAETVAAARIRAAETRRAGIAAAEREAQLIRTAAQTGAEAEALRVVSGTDGGGDDAVRAVAERIVERNVDR